MKQSYHRPGQRCSSHRIVNKLLPHGACATQYSILVSKVVAGPVCNLNLTLHTNSHDTGRRAGIAPTRAPLAIQTATINIAGYTPNHHLLRAAFIRQLSTSEGDRQRAKENTQSDARVPLRNTDCSRGYLRTTPVLYYVLLLDLFLQLRYCAANLRRLYGFILLRRRLLGARVHRSHLRKPTLH